MAHVFSFEFCKISKNTFFTEQVWATASTLSYSTSRKGIGGRKKK